MPSNRRLHLRLVTFLYVQFSLSVIESLNYIRTKLTELHRASLPHVKRIPTVTVSVPGSNAG